MPAHSLAMAGGINGIMERCLRELAAPRSIENDIREVDAQIACATTQWDLDVLRKLRLDLYSLFYWLETLRAAQ